MSMSKKDYEMVASVLSEAGALLDRNEGDLQGDGEALLDYMTDEFVKKFGEANPSFRPAIFREESM